jgi:hypothetical protein
MLNRVDELQGGDSVGRRRGRVHRATPFEALAEGSRAQCRRSRLQSCRHLCVRFTGRRSVARVERLLDDDE